MSTQNLTPAIADNNRRGLTTTEAHALLKQFGRNAVVEEKAHPLKEFLKRFWAPIPWLLEATIIIQLFLGENVEAAVARRAPMAGQASRRRSGTARLAPRAGRAASRPIQRAIEQWFRAGWGCPTAFPKARPRPRPPQ